MSDRARSDSPIVLVPIWTEPEERRAVLCQAFYRQVYQDSFPKPDEAERPETWMPLMQPDPAPGKPRVFIVLASREPTDATEPVVLGGVVFELYRDCGDWLMTYIAVRQDQRGAGLARRLFDEAIRTIRAQAARRDWQLYAEAENPTCFAGADRAEAYARLPLLAELGLRRLPFAYIQPALDATKNELNSLMLLLWARTDAPTPTPARLMTFLREFYAALNQPDAAALHAMEAALSRKTLLSADGTILARPLPKTPARYDATLGFADAITLRMTFLAHYIQDLGSDSSEAVLGDIPLDRVRPSAKADKATTEIWHRLTDVFRSFHADIVIPFASASSLPLILQGQPFREYPPKEPGTCAPPTVRLVFPRKLKIDWEGEPLVIRMSARDEDEWVVEGKLVDSIALFESGYIAYSVAVVLGAGSDARPAINATAILAMAAVAETAGRVIGDPVRMAFGDAAPQPVHEFLRQRLQSLAAIAKRGDCTAFSALGNASDAELGATLQRGLRVMTFRDTTDPSRAVNTKVSISLEVIGAQKHTQIIEAAEAAAKRLAPVNAFTLRLAGLTQNVLDFENQDEIEIHDSLAGGCRLGEEMTFAHRDLTMRFSRSSRAYGETWAVVGGEPYWLLVEFILSHNAKLLLDLNEEIRGDQGATGLTGLMLNMLTREVSLTDPAGIAEAKLRLRRTQGRRIRLAHYIPNLFRYPTERALFEQFTDAKGLTIQRDYFLGLEDTMEKMVREIAVLDTGIAEAATRAAEQMRQADDGRRNNLLVAIGVVQATGVFAAFAAVFATFGSVPDSDLSTFGREVSRELGLGAVGEGVEELTKHVGISGDQWLKMLSQMGSGDAWPLVAALALVAASFSFVGAVGLIFAIRQMTRRRALTLSAALAIALPAVLAFAVWIVSRSSGMPVLGVLLLTCLAAGLAPSALYSLWRSRS